MSAHEERQRIVRENIPKLIRSLTKLEPSDPNFQLCEQCAWNTIRNHRNLAVNSHEVRRRIDGVVEKFVIGNYPEHAEHFKRLCDEIITHPLCLNHYEVDVHWAIVEFLLECSYNPVGCIRRSHSKVELINFKTQEEQVQSDVEYWINLLKEDCIPIDQQQCELVDSELSDWSECTSDNESTSSKEKTESDVSKSKNDSRLKPYIKNQELKPPEKEPHYTQFDSTSSKQWLLNNVQHSWWQDSQSNADIRGVNIETNFCQLWTQCVISTSTTFKKITPISTTSEYCLLREIIWMFREPTTCKFFNLNNGKITVNNDISIPSVTQHALKSFLSYFVPYMEKLHQLQLFIKGIYDYRYQIRAPCTYDCYADGLNELLKPFFDKLAHTEDRIKSQNIGEINTILQFRYEFEKDFQYLDHLHLMHVFSVLDYKKFPSHICAAHLLSGLIHKFRTATSLMTANLAVSLFLPAVKSFCHIIDTWWTEGRLDDWRNEFLVEKKSVESEEVVLRLYEKCKEKSFFVPHTVSSVIQHDTYIALLKEHSIEAGCTLYLLYQINKINELVNSTNFNDTLYDSFLEIFMQHVSSYKTKNELNLQLENRECSLSQPNETVKEFKHKSQIGPLNELLSFEDEFLEMAFTCGNSDVSDDLEENYTEVSSTGTAKGSLYFLNLLNSVSQIILPLEDMIMKSFSSLLKSRISLANNFVINLYKKEFEIEKHLQNMRKVMLLGASDVMHIFYVQLFKQIESGKTWANPFLLTVQLDDILCAKIPNMSSLFCIDIASPFKCETTRVIDAVDQLKITYDVNKQLQNIISAKNLLHYNEVFRFLLKVKWGLWALENMQFHRKYKTQPPYAELKMVDLLMRRLEQLRFWILYALQSIHFYLMTHVLQSMGLKLDEKIEKCSTLSEMRSVHDSFVEIVSSHCFLKSGTSNIRTGVEQLLNLVYVLRCEWTSCLSEIEDENLTDDIDDTQSAEYVMSSQIDAIESTYIRCHEYLANVLNNEVYAEQNSHLAGLSAAFNGSMPY